MRKWRRQSRTCWYLPFSKSSPVNLQFASNPETMLSCCSKALWITKDNNEQFFSRLPADKFSESHTCSCMLNSMPCSVLKIMFIKWKKVSLWLYWYSADCRLHNHCYINGGLIYCASIRRCDKVKSSSTQPRSVVFFFFTGENWKVEL